MPAGPIIQAGLQASTGQTEAQVPHSLHFLALIE